MGTELDCPRWEKWIQSGNARNIRAEMYYVFFLNLSLLFSDKFKHLQHRVQISSQSQGQRSYRSACVHSHIAARRLPACPECVL